MGTAYAGFQRQPGKVTVQSVIEETIGKVTQDRVRVDGSGRTDAGAHALAQVIAFTTTSALAPEVLQRALNATLPRDIAVTSVCEVGPGFHPRFDAHSRTYRYLIYNRRAPSPFWQRRAAHIRHALDHRAMAAAAGVLLGRHDFAAFVPVAQSAGSVRTMYRSDCSRQGDLIAVYLRASGFKQQMARCIAGTLVRAGEGKVDAAEMAAILASKDRRRAGETMPPHGLYLAAVHYQEDKDTGACLDGAPMQGFEEKG